MKEIWKDIKGYEGLYQISNYGRVKSLDREIIDSLGRKFFRKGKILKQGKNSGGYMQITLSKGNKLSEERINRLVAIHFIPIPEHLKDIPIEKLEVGHLKKLTDDTEDKTANEVWNLAWMSKKENDNYGTLPQRKSKIQTNHPQKSKPVLQIDPITNEVITEFPSCHEAARQLGKRNASSICGCCLQKISYNSAYGYIWRYK